MAHPEMFDPRLADDAAGDVLYIPENTLHRRRPEVQRVVTRIAMLEDAEREIRRREAALARELSTSPDLRCVRAFVEVDGALRERLVMVALEEEWDDHPAEQAAAAVTSFGGRLVRGPEMADRTVGYLANAGSVLSIRRHSSLPEEEYLRRYVPGCSADPSI